jgi:hypothetical protein
MPNSLGRWLRRGGWIPLLELALVVAIALVLARWTWLLLAPPSAAASAFASGGEPPVASAVKRGLFGTPPDAARAGDAPASSFRLLGVISPGAARGGWAILAPEGGRARAFGAGESVAPGVIVREIGPDYAVLVRGGASERVTLAARRSADAHAHR